MTAFNIASVPSLLKLIEDWNGNLPATRVTKLVARAFYARLKAKGYKAISEDKMFLEKEDGYTTYTAAFEPVSGAVMVSTSWRDELMHGPTVPNHEDDTDCEPEPINRKMTKSQLMDAIQDRNALVARSTLKKLTVAQLTARLNEEVAV